MSDRLINEIAAMRATALILAQQLGRVEAELRRQESARPEDMVETAVAAAALGVPRDTVASLCRRKGFGRKVGGRWHVNMRALRDYFAKRDKREGTHRVSFFTHSA